MYNKRKKAEEIINKGEKAMAESVARVYIPYNLINKKTSIKSMLYLNMREM